MNKGKLGVYLQALRKQKNYTQIFVAQKIGVIRQTYSHYETGRVCPPITTLCQLADLYAISLENLLEAANEPQESGQEKNEMLYPLSLNERELIRFYRLLEQHEQEEVIALIEVMAIKKQNRK